jgi:hypothetical protein
MGGMYAKNVESSIEADWKRINSTIDTSGVDGIYNTEDDLSKEEFVSETAGSFRLIVVIGSAVTVYLLAGIFSSAFIATRSDEVTTAYRLAARSTQHT